MANSMRASNDSAAKAMEKLKLGPESQLKIWTDGAAKDNHVPGVGRVAGVGVVFGNPGLPQLFGPVEFNLTEKATNNAAELQAAILGLEQAKEKGFYKVELNTDSKFLENTMTQWLDGWKAKNWRKSDGKPLKISVDLLKKLDKLRSEMDITWKWLPRNSSPEMVLADKLANYGCERQIQAQELEANKLFRRTSYDRRLTYPDELPPTFLRTKDQVLLPTLQSVHIRCTLDISERLKQTLINNKTDIKKLSSDQNYGGYLVCGRTYGPLEADGTVVAQCTNIGCGMTDVGGNNINPTLVLPKGSVVGVGFSGAYAENDEVADKGLMAMLFFTSDKMKKMSN